MPKAAEECLAILIKPFSLEKKMEFKNMSVMGGFDTFVLRWLGEAKLPAAAGGMREKLTWCEEQFREYRFSPHPRRKQIHHDCSLAINEMLNSKAPTAPAGIAPTPARTAPTPAGTAPTRPPNKVVKEKMVARFAEKAPPLSSPIQYAKGVGPQLAKRLACLGLTTIEDLLFHFPRRYEDRSRMSLIADAEDGAFQTVYGTVVGKSETRIKRRLTITKVIINDGSAPLVLVWFNQPFRASSLAKGTRLYATGKVERRFRELQMNNPEYEIESDEDTLHTARIVPVYPLTEHLSQKVLRKIIWACIEIYRGTLRDLLPPALISRYGFPGLPEAILAVHFPDDFKALEHARDRLIYEELFFLQMGLLRLKSTRTALRKEKKYDLSRDFVDRFESILPFAFTGAQRKVISEILEDLHGEKPMSRLIQGDVGSGKTVVAACAIKAAIENGYQGGIMAPTEILAEQHYLKFREVLEPEGVTVGLLKGSLTKKEKEKVHERLRDGSIQVAVGTHALIQDEVLFHRLGLIVVDEQHRFGVMQRAELQKKGLHPDMLVMTATPIPRTLALTLYGDLDLSVIDELPPGRQRISSRWSRFREAPKVYEFVRKQVSEGRQAYIVCPLVDESDKIEAKAATREAEDLKSSFFPDLRVALLHGRMKGADKEEIMRDFREGRSDILISTTVIEVGVDVPNATVMVILNADRFGLAQLHQLRGRVGRGSKQSYCFFIADPTTEEGQERMKIMEASEDGFLIAEKDLHLRGPGEFYGTRQHGLPDLKIADLVRDHRMLEKARTDAQELIEKDRAYCAREDIRQRIDHRFQHPASLIH
ncbi:MAG: ATP-dependent DNA helicase RecG [Candidatus Eremiobacteraeota bacterium]|nr:ATP-dependent DNA helicase RecG [Candidatus Eremiobacteraeota bacterium]